MERFPDAIYRVAIRKKIAVNARTRLKAPLFARCERGLTIIDGHLLEEEVTGIVCVFGPITFRGDVTDNVEMWHRWLH